LVVVGRVVVAPKTPQHRTLLLAVVLAVAAL
jgi:hypothetical protein